MIFIVSMIKITNKLIKNVQGFFILDTAIGTACIIVIATMWFFLGSMQNALYQKAQHITAIFLTQQYLNEMEYAICENLEIELDSEKIRYNETDFTIEKQLNKNDLSSYLISVKVEWIYENSLQSELQERVVTVY